MACREGKEPVKKAEATVAGHICLDIIPEIQPRTLTFAEGRLVEIGRALISTGGPVSNTGLALHRLGIATQLMGKVGDDLFGRAVREIVARHDPALNRGMIESPGAVTSYSLILSPPGRDRMLLHCSGANDTFSAQDVPYSRLKETRLFHLGYPPLMRHLIENDGAQLQEIFRCAKETGVTTCLDMCMPDERSFSGSVNWPAILERTLPHVDLFMPSFEETLFMLYPELYRRHAGRADSLLAATEPDLVRTMGRDLIGLGPKMVALKVGHMGLYLRTAPEEAWRDGGRALPRDLGAWSSRELWCPCFKTVVVGTTGTGDSTIAGFLACLLRNEPPPRCMLFACAVGACNVEAADALSGVRSWESTRARMAAGWERLPLPFEMCGWFWNADEGVWSRSQDASSLESQR